MCACIAELVMVLTKAVSSCGLDMSEVRFVDLRPLDGARVVPLGDEGPGDGLDGVADGVTLRGRAAADEGGIVNSAGSWSVAPTVYQRRRRRLVHVRGCRARQDEMSTNEGVCF